MEMSLVASLLASPVQTEVDLEQHCLIENVVREASGEGVEGMRLVTEVTLNRYNVEYRGKFSYCGVVYDPKQFSWTNIREDRRRKYKDREYEKAAQIVFSYLYGDLPRLLPKNTFHYINVRHASDLSWYDPTKVVYRHKNHEFLILKKG